MVESTHLLATSLVALVIIAVPGPSVLFVISRGVSLGRKAALATVVGNEVGGGACQVAQRVTVMACTGQARAPSSA